MEVESRWWWCLRGAAASGQMKHPVPEVLQWDDVGLLAEVCPGKFHGACQISKLDINCGMANLKVGCARESFPIPAETFKLALELPPFPGTGGG